MSDNDLQQLKEKRKRNRLIAIFLFCVTVDIAGKNLFVLFEDQTYFIFQSVTFLCYITFIHLLCRDKGVVLKTLSLNLIAFAVSDLIDELTGNGDKFYWMEYIAFAVSIPLTIYEIRKLK